MGKFERLRGAIRDFGIEILYAQPVMTPPHPGSPYIRYANEYAAQNKRITGELAMNRADRQVQAASEKSLRLNKKVRRLHLRGRRVAPRLYRRRTEAKEKLKKAKNRRGLIFSAYGDENRGRLRF